MRRSTGALLLLLCAVRANAGGPSESQIRSLADNPMLKPIMGQMDKYASVGGAANAAFDATPLGAALVVVRKVLTVVKIVHAIYTVVENLGVPESQSLGLAFRLLASVSRSDSASFGQMLETIERIAERAGTGDASFRLADARRAVDLLPLDSRDRARLRLALEGTVALRDAKRATSGTRLPSLGEVEGAAAIVAAAGGRDADFRAFQDEWGSARAIQAAGRDVEAELRIWREGSRAAGRDSTIELERSRGSSYARALAEDAIAVERLRKRAWAEAGAASTVGTRPGAAHQVLSAVEAVLEWVVSAGTFIAQLEPLTHVQIPTVKEIVSSLTEAALDELARSGEVQPEIASAAGGLLSGRSSSIGNLRAVFLVCRALGARPPAELDVLLRDVEEIRELTSMSTTEAPRRAARALRLARNVLRVLRVAFGGGKGEG